MKDIKNVKNVAELFDVKEDETVTVSWYLSGSQGIPYGWDTISVKGSMSIEDFTRSLQFEKEDLVAQDYGDYIDYPYSKDDDEYDEDDYLEADSEGFADALNDCGTFYFDVKSEAGYYRYILTSCQEIEINDNEDVIYND